jgi:predicted negative regulator of RcsB-dependent stress response
MTEEKNNNGKSWKFNRQVNVSVLIQIVLLASLIVGSWVNLQGQLDMLQKSIAFEYRIRAIEKQINGENPQTETFNDLGERR